MAAEEYEIEISDVVAAEDPTDRYVVIEYIPASARRITKLQWSYVRPGGCGDLHVELNLPYDTWGLDFRTRRIQQFNHIVLRIRGVIWWQGTIETLTSKLDTPEIIVVEARGYAFQAEKATLSWTYARQSLKTAGEIGEIPGVIRSMYLLLPLLFGTERNMPHPLADKIVIDGSTSRPRGLVFDNVTLWEIFSEMATLAGNYDWGVDHNRQFYFTAPQVRTSGTSLYTSNPAVSVWSSSASTSKYGDETYLDPQAVPPYLPVYEESTFVLGNDVSALETPETVQSSKNVLLVVAAPKRSGGAPQLFTVADSEWLDFWKRRLVARIATPFFSEEADVREWASNRLRLLGRPQVNGTIKAVYLQDQRATPPLPLGATRYIDPDSGIEIVERTLEIKCSFDQHDHLAVEHSIGYQIPPDLYFAEQLRRDATLAQNALVGERVPFILGERMAWYHDEWSAFVS